MATKQVLGTKTYSKTNVTKSELISDILSGVATKEAFKNISMILSKAFVSSELDKLARFEIDLKDVHASNTKHTITIKFSIIPVLTQLRFDGAQGTLVIPYTTETWSDFNQACRKSLSPFRSERWDMLTSFVGRYVTRVLHALAMQSTKRKLNVDEYVYLEMCGKWLVDHDVEQLIGSKLKANSIGKMDIVLDNFDHSPLDRKQLTFI